MSEAVFEPTKILESVGGDVELAAELLHAYAEDAPERLSALEESLETEDVEGAVRASHSLKGMSGVVRAPQLVDRSLALELLGREGKLDLMRERFPAFRDLLLQGLQEIGAFLASVE